MRVKFKVQEVIVTFLPMLLLCFAIKCLAHVLYIFFNINNKNSYECSPKIIACSSLAYIFGAVSKVRALCVRICQTGKWPKIFVQLGIECLQKIASNS